MKLFQDSRGFIIAFGFDMVKRVPDPHMVAWNDPHTGVWTTDSANMSGTNSLPFKVAPEFIFETDGRVVAYQPSMCIEMTFIGNPMIWSFRFLCADKTLNTFLNAA